MSFSFLTGSNVRSAKFFKLLVVALFTIGLSLWCFNQLFQTTHIGFNLSASEPRGFYLMHPVSGVIHRGDLLSFKAPSVHWIEARHYFSPHSELIKTVGALPGERLFVKNHHVYACMKDFNSTCRDLGACVLADEKNRPVECQAWQGIIIPKDHYYMTSQRSRWSLDSRYFGLIAKHDLVARGQLLWTF